jgi:hypothetical protein
MICRFATESLKMTLLYLFVFRRGKTAFRGALRTASQLLRRNNVRNRQQRQLARDMHLAALNLHRKVETGQGRVRPRPSNRLQL